MSKRPVTLSPGCHIATLQTARTKRCSSCRHDKPADTDNFQRDRHSRDGLTHRCKSCRSAARIAAYWADPVKARRQNGRFYPKRQSEGA